MKSFNENLIGLIPAAGKGERLKLPFPKELYPVDHKGVYKPVSQFILENLTVSGIDHVVFVINATKHQLIHYFGDGHKFNCRISYVVQEIRGSENNSASPGLAHAIDAAFHLIKNKTVFFGMADTIIEPLDVFAQAYQDASSEEDVILGVFPTDEPHKFGAVKLNPDKSVDRIEDKRENTKLNEMWGFIIWRSKFTEYLHDCVQAGESDFGKLMNNAIVKEGMKFRGHRVVAGKYLDMGTFEDINRLNLGDTLSVW
jgi:glucose-1-phosphate thymidylyltransferase